MKSKSEISCPPRTAVAYARYSSAGQRDVSIEQQLADIRAYADREGYNLVHVYADHARSGYKNVAARSEFQAMIADAASGSWDTVLCWKVDRFGRSREDSAIYKGQLSRLGVSVVYVMEPIPDGAAGVLTEGMLEAIAEWYSRNLSENVKRGMNDNARRCLYNGATVFGYDGIRNEPYRINEAQAAVVRQIFSLYIDGYTYTEIAKLLNTSGQRTESGRLFTLNKIYNILKQERYTGVYIFGDYRIPDGMPVIIDKETYEKAQRMKNKMSRHYGKNPVDYILTGKAFCGHCGTALVGDSGTSSTGVTHYYYSCGAKKRREGCSKKSVRKDALEDFVISFLLDHVLTPSEMERIADAIMEHQRKEQESSPLRAMEKELQETVRKIANINNAIAEGIYTSSTAAMLQQLEDTAASLRRSVDSRRYAEGQLMDRDFVLFFLAKFAGMDRSDPRDRKLLINTFLNSVYVYDDHYRIFINTSDNPTTIPFSDLPPDDPVRTDSPTVCQCKHARTFPVLQYIVRT